MQKRFLVLGSIIAALGCGDLGTGCCPGSTESGPVFIGTVTLDGAPAVGVSILRGVVFFPDNCAGRQIFSEITTESSESGSYLLYLAGLTGGGDGPGSPITEACAELVATDGARVDSVVVRGLTVRASVVDTIRADFSLGS